MHETRYLIVGSSHAALEALEGIRLVDTEGSLTLATRDPALPYSPTVLPYVVSGRSDAQRVFLRDERFFEKQNAQLRKAELLAIDAEQPVARFSGGLAIRFEKLLLATGAVPAVPPIPGLDQVRFHVLRTLEDAMQLKSALAETRNAVVLGGGLVGMHAAENLVKAGAQVTIIEMQPRVLSGYFDQKASALIEQAFAARGARVLCGQQVVAVERRSGGFSLRLSSGADPVEGELLVVGTGVKPAISYLTGSGIEARQGILVDARMRTSRAGVWAAGDVAQAPSFYDGAAVVNGIVPNAAEQGRVAGMDMAGDAQGPRFRGAVPVNTYHFFGKQALSVGAANGEGERYETFDAPSGRYQRLVLKEGRLQAIASINRPFDPGIMLELIRRRVDLGPVKGAFISRPQHTARALMSSTWR